MPLFYKKGIHVVPDFTSDRFYIQGKNLITFSDFKLWDPEVNANYGNVYPLIRTFAIGANVNF